MTAPRPDHTRDMRWPLQPLLDRVKLSAHALGKVKGFTGGQVNDAKANGLSDLMADRWATKLRIHPSQAWPEWDRVALLPSDDIFINGTATAAPGWRQAWEWAEARRPSLTVAPAATEPPDVNVGEAA